MKAIVVEFSVRSALAHNDVDEYANFPLLVLMKKNATIIYGIWSGTIGGRNELKSFLDANKSSTLNTKRPRPFQIMRLDSSKSVLAWATFSEDNYEYLEDGNILNEDK